MIPQVLYDTHLFMGGISFAGDVPSVTRGHLDQRGHARGIDAGVRQPAIDRPGRHRRDRLAVHHQPAAARHPRRSAAGRSFPRHPRRALRIP